MRFSKSVQFIAWLLATLLSCILFASGVTPVSSQTLPDSKLLAPLLIQPPAQVQRVGNLEVATVTLDGEPLLRIAALVSADSDGASEPGELTAVQLRAQTIAANLYRVLATGFDPQSLQVEVAKLNDQSVILASDSAALPSEIILTVTDADTKIASQPIDSLAQSWAQTIHDGLLKAWNDRSPQARRQQRIQTLQIGLALLGTSFLISRFQQYLQTWFNRARNQQLQAQCLDTFTSEPSAGSDNDPTKLPAIHLTQLRFAQWQNIALLPSRLLRFMQSGIWIGGIVWILYLFPETRWLGQWVVSLPIKIIIVWIAISFLQQLLSLGIDRWIRNWVELASLSHSRTQQEQERIALRAPTLATLLKRLSGFVVYLTGILFLLAWLRVPLESILTGAGLLGVTLGILFQNLIKDLTNGIRIAWDDEFTVGDVVEIEGVSGSVEQLKLLTTIMRGAGGQLIAIPNSQIGIIHNLTKDWARVEFKTWVAYDTNLLQAMQIMQDVAEAMYRDPSWHDDILEPNSLLCVNQVDANGVELLIWIKTKRMQQWSVEREFCQRLKLAFDQNGIKLGAPR
jgi:moderate conductance mechanosensitive channel